MKLLDTLAAKVPGRHAGLVLVAVLGAGLLAGVRVPLPPGFTGAPGAVQAAQDAPTAARIIVVVDTLDVAQELRELRADVSGLAAAVDALKRTDITALVSSVDSLRRLHRERQ